MSVIIDGTNGLTFNNSTVQASAGQVLQVVSVSNGTDYGTTGTTFVAATNVNASITPKFATSKILIRVNGGTLFTAGTSYQMQVTIVRNNSINLGNSTRGFGQLYNGAGQTQAQLSIEYLDSPATTSSTNYCLYFKSGGSGQQVYANIDGGLQTITLMEIAA